ncbi:MAG: RecX family transcriptional regulator [Candidatus Gracilibacteria bacterium]|nr:RecX family transcriptional regulator [Candidatus Gracilibacteria bacterium]
MKQISQKIIDYAIWYYLKYYPSPKKFAIKLKQRYGTQSELGEKYGGITDEQINFIIKEKLSSIVVEDEVIKSKIRILKDKGKSKLYIKQKLYERMEQKDLIETYLEEAFLDGENENLLREFKKLEGKFEKNKIYEKLIRKGFNYDDIKKLF